MSGYMKRYLIPAFWQINKKESKWAPRPSAGPHAKDASIPFQLIVRDILKLTENIRETKKIIKSGEILIDKKKRRDPKYPVGFMDVIEIPQIRKYYRMAINKKGLNVEEIKGADASRKLCKITSKSAIKGGKLRLGLHDGRNLIVDNNDYKTGDSLLISLPGQKIIKHFKFEKGVQAVVMAGKNIGIKGKIKGIRKKKFMLEHGMIDIETESGELLVPKEYVIVGEFK